MFFYDRNTCHISKHTKQWLERNHINNQYCPTRSPDLNAIELIRNTLQNKVTKYNPETEEELENCIKKEWKGLSLDIINNTIDHVKKTIPKIFKAEGEFVQ